MKILITYEYFDPAYKAGGPIQSLVKLVNYLAGLDYEVYILCSNRDLDNTKLLVTNNKWVYRQENVKVMYNSNNKHQHVFNVIKEVKPNIVYINGLYSLPYSIFPLLSKCGCKKIVAVRGMLQPGALSQKRHKKRIFITIFKLLGLHKNCTFHATSLEEMKCIKSIFGSQVPIKVIPNLVNQIHPVTPHDKKQNILKIVSICVLSPMKNIQFILTSLMSIKHFVFYDIYGPVKDNRYWQECLKLIHNLPTNIIVNYKGAIPVSRVNNVLSDYHYFILPSKSENFGHAIFEALSAGIPVITSHNTPWNNLKKCYAGYNITIDNTSELTEVLEEVALQNDEQYRRFHNGAIAYATKIDNTEFNTNKMYQELFS